jgi:RimJ/RimL family protein N-acetyltransferase
MPPVVIGLPDRLEHDGVALRPMHVSDAASYAAAFRDDPQLGRLLGVETDPDEASIRERIASQPGGPGDRTFCQFAIADPGTGAFWGEVLVFALNERHRRGEVGFWVMPARRRAGVGSRAVSMAVGWMFGELDLLRVEMTTTPDNRVVPALARRLGFTREGLLRARNIERGQRVDVVWFGLLREEWAGL